MTDISKLLDDIEFLKGQQKLTNDVYNKQIKELSNELQKEMLKADRDSVETDRAVAFYRKETKVKVEDWDAVMHFVLDNDAIDILQRRISPSALVNRNNAGDVVPGVKVVEGKVFIVKCKGGKVDEEGIEESE